MSLREKSSYCEVIAIASCVTASSVPPAFAPSANRWIVAGRLPSAVHLLSRQHQPHRALQRPRGEHCQHHLILRPQSRAESAADKRRDHPYVVRFHVEYAAEIALHVLHALRLVVDRELAVAVPHHRRRVQFHRIVMFDRDEVFRLMAHGGEAA